MPQKTLVQAPGNRRRILILAMLGLFLQWSGNGLTFYYLVRIRVRVLNAIGISNPREQNVLKGRLMIFNWITAVSSAFLTGPPETSNTVPD